MLILMKQKIRDMVFRILKTLYFYQPFKIPELTKKAEI